MPAGGFAVCKSPDWGLFSFSEEIMTSDAFSNRHPAVNFLFFLGAIGFAVLIQHPAYLIAGALGAAADRRAESAG